MPVVFGNASRTYSRIWSFTAADSIMFLLQLLGIYCVCNKPDNVLRQLQRTLTGSFAEANFTRSIFPVDVFGSSTQSSMTSGIMYFGTRVEQCCCRSMGLSESGT